LISVSHEKTCDYITKPVPCATGLLGSSLRNSPVIKQGYRPVLKFRSIGPGVRKSGFANGSPKGILRSFAIGNDG